MTQHGNRCEKSNGSEGIGEQTGRMVGRVIDSMAQATATAARAAVGTVAGGIAGFAKAINSDQAWDAHQFSWGSRSHYPSRNAADAGSELHQDWISTDSQLAWDAACEASGAAWDRVEYATVNKNQNA